ncbi:mediator of RNA polymerase II transcription subunit 13 isoform X5 [Drosophila mauritiana]|uniref:Mediator of RNA polymerase II transcription subunit 13 isoform X5 n=1 Tax=Drosophila mauritiana TaxID=7226 RepID=A0A6P8JUC8_DROMA|nr:mediator of RNA polymerase II transcription subunit 13 isoform X5 [Drosophila mauritiana]
MDLSLERDSSALGSLFQQIINDMKNTSPLWEDFVAKAGKLHTCLRAAIQAIAAYLDAFQKIADAATNSRGASKEIGTALTRVCLRHKAVETRLKTFTSAIMDCLVQPLQERIEDWKRTVATIDKDHAKEYKRCRSELKKRSSDTLRLQKKARKGQTDGLQSLMDSHMQDVTLRRAELEEVEKKSLRAAMVEERLRYCSFVHMLQPVVHEECEVMSELGHLQEAMQSIALVTKEPSVLPQASEELIHDAKASINLYPESPGGGSGSQGGGCSNSLGSRKSSVCSISSMNSSGSSNSPGHHHYPRSLSQFVTPAIRLKPGESSDSGFCSSPALTTQTSNATNQTANVSTWPPHSQDGVDTLPPTADRPHTISTAYEKGHQRPPLTVYTFQNPETIHESGSCLNNGTAAPNGQPLSGQATPATQKSPAASLSRPPLPVRCSSLERPLSAQSNHRQGSGNNLLQRQCPSPIPAHITKELSAAHHAQQQQQQNQQPQTPPTYVNMSELATMAALKQTNQQQKPSTPPLQQQSSIDSTSSQHSNDSTGSHQLLQQQHHQSQQNHHSATATRSHSISSTASSLHSHPSIDSTVACGSLVGQHNHSTSTNTNTTSPSSGSSTPQNHYSPLLTNSPTSTAAGTPSGSSLGPGSGLGFVYQVSSPTPPSSEVLKITEQAAAGQDQGPANSVADETDERSRASVLQKASMFEKAAAAAAVSPPAPIQIASGSPASGGGTRRSEAEQQEMDKSFEDSIQALNNLIGELDSFQREIDEGKVKPPSNIISGSTTSSNNNNTTTSSISSSDNNNLPATSNIEPCAISNQTNSSGCGTDISDTTSDELAGDDMDVRRRDRDRDRDRDLLGASDSELSRCYVSETSSLTGGLTAGGYENPTFAHFAANANREDAVSLASDSVCLGQPRHAYVDTCSDSGSAVVVIYDHQIPNTPDIEFVKQNSEIVVLRTKDPQPHALQLHEMRELQQLPANLAGSPDSSPDSAGGQPPPTATVAPAKQRLSSFRATSEQQLQLLGRGSPQRGKTPSEQAVQSRPQDQHFPQTQQQDIDGSSPPVELARRQLPPKPTSLSIFNGPVPTAGDRPVVPRKSDFKADLDAKIRRQKLKVKQQLQQQQQQQQETQQQQQAPQEQQHSPQSPQTRNCNVTNQQAANITASASESASAFATATASTDPYPNPNHRMPNQNQTATSNHTQCKTPTMALSPSSPRGHLPLSSSSLSSLPLPATTSSPSNARPSMLPASDRPPAHPYVCSNAPANPHHANSISNGNAHLKPCITPRPASLSGGAAGGGSTRIGRRSSINQAKPPPPVRRSSSVTPSPNASVGLQQQPQHATLSQQNHQLSSSSEHLPPPPPFMLDAMPQIPSSALKVSETVRALAAMRHQPASPVSLRRMQQQQQQQQLQQQQVQQQQPLLQSAHNSPLNEDLTVYYDSYLDLHAYAQALASGQQPGGQQMANQQRFTHQQQHQHLHQPQPQPPPVYQVDATFRTSSPAAGGGGGGGIYAQPKLVNSMSSFRTSSPSPNGHAHPLPPTQPKANPNLIAQLNARLSGKQQQQHVEGIYGNQQAPGGESIYMRSGLSMSQPQQQQHYDAAPGSANSHYQPPQPPNAAVANSKDMAIYSSSFTKNPAAAQSPNMRQAHSHQHHQPPQQQHYTCPPPLEDPPPPPIYAAGASATMPKKMARPPTGQNASHSSAYAAASSTATLPKNMMQQQQQQQRLHQQYQQPTGMGIGNGNGHLGQRPQLPLPQQKLRAAQQQHLAEQQQHQLQQQHHQQQQHQQHQQHQQRQPPIPSRHSSVQQKIFVSTNPFIQTTAVKFHSPSASPTCGSPVTGSLASIYATTSRGGHHHQQQQAQQQQQHHYRDAAGGNSNGGAAYYNHNAHAHSQAHHPNYATSTNIEKTGSIRAKTKAEFLENLNAKLAKQGMSGRAFAVRNLINSKALMYQNPQKLSRPSAQYRRPPTYPNTSTTTNATCEDQC